MRPLHRLVESIGLLFFLASALAAGEGLSAKVAALFANWAKPEQLAPSNLPRVSHKLFTGVGAIA
jgi:hypothetical protein